MLSTSFHWSFAKRKRSCFELYVWKCQLFVVLTREPTLHPLKNRRMRADESWVCGWDHVLWQHKPISEELVTGVFMCGWISSRVEYQDQQFPKPHYVMQLPDIIHFIEAFCIQRGKWDWSMCAFGEKTIPSSELNLTTSSNEQNSLLSIDGK